MINERRLKSECMDILTQHEDILKYILQQEKDAINRRSKIGDSGFETVKKTLLDEGMKIGIDRFMELINHYANKDV